GLSLAIVFVRAAVIRPRTLRGRDRSGQHQPRGIDQLSLSRKDPHPTEMRGIQSCLPETAPVDIAPLNGRDLSCAAVSSHVADLLLAAMLGLAQDNVAASVLTDPAELRADTLASCKDERWSEDLRRCYAGATRFDHFVACNLN